MPLFKDKISKYKKEDFKVWESHYEKLKSGQKPHTFLITCADSRLCPQEITQSQAGEIFVIRNAGNMIPEYDENRPTNEGFTLEYGLRVLQIPELIVCGHISCGAMAGLSDTKQVQSLSIVSKALENYKKSNFKDIDGKDIEKLISWNVDNQLVNLFSYPFVRELMTSGKLKVFGMVYDFVRAEIVHQSELLENGEVQSQNQGQNSNSLI